MQDTRTEFTNVLKQQKDLIEQFRAVRQEDSPFYEEYHQALEAVFRQKHGKRRKFDPKKIDTKEEGYAEVFERFLKRSDEICDTFFDERERLEADLASLAEHASLSSDPGMSTLYRIHYEIMYRSQGYGAARYAEGKAILDRRHAERHSIPAHIVRRELRYTQFEVWVEGDALDVEILRRKPALTLREQVRLCWASGVNPRVYLPELPYDYESKAGLDHFGGERG